MMMCMAGKHHWDIMAMGNSTLAGLVAITAGCSTVLPWGAICIGIVAGLLYPLASRLMILIKVGHPLTTAFHCQGCLMSRLAAKRLIAWHPFFHSIRKS